MTIKILMPSLSPTMDEGSLAKWLKAEGDSVKPGDIIAEIETDKATMEIETIEEGIIGKIFVPASTHNVKVGTLIAILLEEGETIADIKDLTDNSATSAELKIEAKIDIDKSKKDNHSVIDLTSEAYKNVDANVQNSKDTNNQISEETRILASPLAKRLAKEQNIDLNNITGTGPNNRIIKADIEGVKQSQCAGGKNIDGEARVLNEFNLVPNNNIRKIIANRLQESKQTIPHFYLSIECSIDKLLSIREDLNQRSIKEDKISVNDFIIIASAKTLAIVSEVNASWTNENIKSYNNIDISVAVSTSYGLITPIIKNADRKNIYAISSEMKMLANKAKANKLIPVEFQGGGFSISNLGMFGIKNFSAIINPPQSAILAIGASSKRPVITNDAITIANIMDVTLSCDHRVVDGAVGAKFLSVFKDFIEHPALLLI